MASANAPVNRGELFVRKATGLVRSWSLFDAFIYATFSINLITLGLYIFSFTYTIPASNLVAAIIISALFVLFEVVVYGAMIAIMPRTGADYVWQSRIFGGAVGFILAVTGWWFILWYWIPLYAQIMVYEVLAPVLGILGLRDLALWFSNDNTGLFIACLIVIGFVTLYVAIGLRTYARIQKICFYGGMLGLLIVIGLLLSTTPERFAPIFDHATTTMWGAPANAYQNTLTAGGLTADTLPPLTQIPLLPTLLLIPYVVFFNLWPNWGATLYGEVKGASDFRRNIYSMGGALIVTTILALILLAAIAKGIGWDFYHAANAAFWNKAYDTTGTLPAPPLPIFPYPVMLISYLVSSPVLQLGIVLLISLWFWGWAGTVFLSSTRVIFAAAFDRILPERVAEVDPRFRTPVYALLLMTIPSIIVSALWAYLPIFRTLILDATLVIAVTYLGTALAATFLPYIKPDLYRASPIAKYQIAGLPMLTVVGAIFSLFLLFNLFLWFRDAIYGVNNSTSLLFMGAMYLLAILIYVGARAVRRRNGIDLSLVYKEIPVD
jgi:basic amino acid/polyamine antiporter, APA family